MVAALDRDAERATRELNGLLAVSGELFRGLGDPINSDPDLTAHRWLRGDREESYSDWLALILGQQADFRKILNMFSPETIGSGGHRLITREDCIPEGRTDILIQHETIGTLLVEVKTGKFPVPSSPWWNSRGPRCERRPDAGEKRRRRQCGTLKRSRDKAGAGRCRNPKGSKDLAR
jgi:hypothetical protein